MTRRETGITEVLNRVNDGNRLSKEDAYEFMISGSLHEIGSAADDLRRQKCGDQVSYVVNRNINFTNICTGTCRFCGYSVKKGSIKGFFHNVREVVDKVGQAVRSGATEVCIQGGLHPDIGLDYYTDLLKGIKQDHNVHIHAFSPMEVKHMADKSGYGISETLLILRESGLDSMPGTAAEIFDREIREEICPDKITGEEWREIITKAHKMGIPSTATMLYGHIERPEHRVNHLQILRDIQDETGGFTEFVPLSYIHYNTPLRKKNPEVKGASGVDDLLIYAISRLFLDNFQNIQASWVKLGRKLSQAALHFGANDMGGTLMEESISSSAGQKVDVFDEGEMIRLIKDAGRTPVKRDTLYNFSG